MSASVIQPDLIRHNGRITTLDRSNPIASAVAIADGRFVAVGSDAEVMARAGSATKLIDLGGRPLLPGLIDNHLHLIRGGLNYNMELRWDGVRSLAVAMEMLKRQVELTPAPQWVRAVGQLADVLVPDRDFFSCAGDDIIDTTSFMTVVGGRIVWGTGPFAQHDAPIPPAMPDWSPVRQYGGYGAWGATQREGAPLQRAAAAAMCGCASACGLHGHAHAHAWSRALPTSDAKGFWGAFGCSCWAI